MTTLNLTIEMLKEAIADFGLSDESEVRLIYKEGEQSYVLVPQVIIVTDDKTLLLQVDHRPIPSLHTP